MNLILNEPCGVDVFFEGGGKGSAQVVADQISEQLRNPSQLKRPDESACGHPVSIIGLNGCWGCGKSNVIELVKQNLRLSKDRANFVFFEYDLWGHRLDLTRKMFLEELIEFLCDEKHYIDAKFKEDVKRLTGRTVERERVDVLSIPAIICALGFLLLPFLQLAADLFKESVAGVFQWGALIVAFAFWGCLVLDLSRRRTLKVAFSRVMDVARGVSPAGIDFEHEIEPSIGRFTKFLREVVGKLGQKKKNLVVILDNMDRLLPEEVIKCLAAVHILFAEKREKWRSNLKIIVPYDATRVGKIFAKTMDSDALMADDYFRRTFDVVYRLSPQLGSGWEQFFDKCYDIVAEGDEKAQKGKGEVREVLDYLVPVAERTPRKLIGILNELATIRMTMKDVEHVRMKDIAVFVCAWPKCELGGGASYVRGNENREDERVNQSEGTQKQPKTIDDLIVEGGFIENGQYRDFVYGTDEKAKLAIATIVYQVKDSREVILRRLICAALTDGKPKQPERMGRLSGMLGFATAFRAAILNDINIGNVDKVPHALEGLKTNRQVCWDEFFEIQKDALIALHQSNATMLQEFERIVLKNISDWAQYAKKLRDKSEDNTEMSRVADSIESVLQESKRTQENSVEAELVSPGAFIDLLTVFERRYKLANQYCDWEKLDEHCVERVGAKEKWRYLYSLRFLAHEMAIRLVETRKKIENCEVPMEMPSLDYYLGILENVTEGQVSCKLSDSVCDVYTKWMNDADNLVRYNLCTDSMECRVVALALRYGGFPWNVKEIDEFINKKKGGESVCAEDELLEMSDHYLSRAQLLKRLQELNRPEPLFQNVLNRLKKEC